MCSEVMSSALYSIDQITLWEKEYSPSQWNKRFSSADEVIKHHVEYATEVSKLNREELPCTLDVKYGNGAGELFDVYGENLPSDAPIFVYVHGGYWQELDKGTSAYCAKPLVEAGYRVMVIDYQLCPEVTLEEIVAQIKRAGKYILQQAVTKNVRHVSFAGHSAGAHLIAAMLGSEFIRSMGHAVNLIKHVYLISGVYKLHELRYTEAVNSGNLLGLNDENVLRLSPLHMDYHHLFSVNIQFHIYVAENDSPVFRQMSAEMHSHLSKAGIESKLQILEHLDHFDIVEKLADNSYLITKNIRNQLT